MEWDRYGNGVNKMKTSKKKREQNERYRQRNKKLYKNENKMKPYDELECAMIMLHVIPDTKLAKILKRNPKTIQDKRSSLRKKYKKMGILESMEMVMV